jgi:general stress protein 26
MNREILDDALALQGGCPFLCLSSLCGGYPETRMVFNLRAQAGGGPALLPPFLGHEGDFDTWIGTNASSRKAAQLRADGRSCLYYADGDGFRGLTLVGDMALVEDGGIKAALWRPGWEVYYPLGPGDPDFAVFHFRARDARHYHGLRVTELDLGSLPGARA